MFVPPMQPIFSSDEDAALASRAESAMEALEADDERMRLRDTFAAAALTGLLTRREYDACEFATVCEYAYRYADAMLRERDSRAGQKVAESDILRAVCTTNHDAAPAAKATADRYVRRAAADGESDRTDKAAPRPSEGTGDTPVTESMPKEIRAEVSDRIDPVSYFRADEKHGDSHTACGPVAWAVRHRQCDTGIVALCMTLADCRGWSNRNWRYDPLYRHPQPALTDAERDAVETAVLEADAHQHVRRAATLRGLLERLK